MLNVIYTYRNRDLKRVKISLDSLLAQTQKNFKVYFVDYGSKPDAALKIKNLCADYDFIDYHYFSTALQPWNKSRALNSVIKKLEKGFCFVADVDMIFHEEFVNRVFHLQEKNRTIYFQVGFLEPNQEVKKNPFRDIQEYRKSSPEATGLSLFPVQVLKELRGFDEFYHFWGSEDSDMHTRIKNAGYSVEFYNSEILMLHQWHPTYRLKEKAGLSKELQISGIVRLNQQHLKFAIAQKLTKVNPKAWGEVMGKEQVEELQNAPINLYLNNDKRKIDDLLYGQFPVMRNKIFKVRINSTFAQKLLKERFKKIIGKNILVNYSLKEINDLILTHLISFYRDQPYIYHVSSDLKNIYVAIYF